LKVRESFRQIFLELGYEEMKTDNFVESSFWNFDTLFQPQQHPARDAHDTFFIRNPAQSKNFPQDLYNRVKTMHEEGGHGSIGWRYNFSDDEPCKNVLRTHTTAATSRTLYQLAQQQPFVPKKYFSIDRVFRNETLDATHLAEFHQVEGFVADYNISLSDLMGAIKEFYKRIGVTNIKFKPAYNPYTEPSMEIFGYSAERQSWMEIGNSGIFRPEMLIPLGLPPNVGVAAWGLSLERPTMIMYHIKNIRELVGHKVDLEMVKTNPICHI
jgi:phenylalanyl-tRNA synthetase alpha chain